MPQPRRKYFEDKAGNASSSRLTSFIIICSALLFVQQLLVFAFIDENTGLVSISVAAGSLFVTIATPALVFMFKQKQTEEATANQPAQQTNTKEG